MARNPDNLDGQSHNTFWTLYFFPGKVILWFRYILAPKGKVFATSRQARSPIVSFFVATLFWAFVAWVAYANYTYVPSSHEGRNGITYVEED